MPKIGEANTEYNSLLEWKRKSRNYCGNQYWGRKSWTVFDELLEAQCANVCVIKIPGRPPYFCEFSLLSSARLSLLDEEGESKLLFWLREETGTTLNIPENSTIHNKACPQFNSVHSLSRVQLFVTAMDCSSPGLPVYHQLPVFMQTHVHWVTDGLQPSHPTISSSVVPFSSHLQSFPALGSFPVSQFFQIRWPKYWSFSFSISPSNEYSGLIFFSMDGLDLLAVQGTLKSLLHHCSSKASILWCSAFFIIQAHIHTWLLEKP